METISDENVIVITELKPKKERKLPTEVNESFV